MSRKKYGKPDINFVDLLTVFLKDVDKYLVRPDVVRYLEISGYVDTQNQDQNERLKKIIKCLITYPYIFREIMRVIVLGNSYISKLTFLELYSAEQVMYITNPRRCDTKLLACPGSGKTRSIIGRIRFLTTHCLVPMQDVYMITFSKHASCDFRKKVTDLFQDHDTFCVLTNFSTIDSLAKSVLTRFRTHKSENVEILSIAFRNFLKEATDAEIKSIKSIKNIRHLFVDEAQDLNEVQYEIIDLLRRRFGTICELIGDPNQNIYQFRRSSSTWLTKYPGVPFELTLNFRSTSQIIEFSEYLKPIPTTRSKSATGKTGASVNIITDSSEAVHRFIVQYLKIYSQNPEKDLCNVAIICPTRGIKTYNNVGLSVFFNLLKMHNISFIQLYDEAGKNDEHKKIVGKKSGHVNLLTYHGTKGLEFDVVFVMDFYQFMSNIQPTETEHNEAQYLAYVATSRAINHMYICTYLNVHGGYLNHWITRVPPDCYASRTPVRIPRLEFRHDNNKKITSGITELIGELTDEQLNSIHDMLVIGEEICHHTRRIYKDFTHIDRFNDEALFGIFCEELFYFVYGLSRRHCSRKMNLIDGLINSTIVVVENDGDCRTLKHYIVNNGLTWESYDQMKNMMPASICKLIERYCSRQREMSEYIVCNNEFIKIVELNIEDIRATYHKYLNPESYGWDYRNFLEDFFYLILVGYSYDNNHYYYINNHGKEKSQLLANGIELYAAINHHVTYNYLINKLEIKPLVRYSKLMLNGEIDFVDHLMQHETIVEIKCVKEISIKYHIQLLLYNFCRYADDVTVDRKNLYCNRFRILNLLTGLEHTFTIKISPENMFKLLSILASLGSLSFTNMNLVYDLETTDRIRKLGPFDRRPMPLPGSIVSREGDKYTIRKFPEIIEIAIRDYETGMIIMDTLVAPSSTVPDIPSIITEITGITNEMLIGKPKIAIVHDELRTKMANFKACKMLAHNGSMFDDQIMHHYSMIDAKVVTFIDTLRLIPIHFPQGQKLKMKNLSSIHLQLFGESFPAHRAMADVNALIRIMRHLKIII